MRAYVCTKYGPPDVLKLTDVPRPTPTADQVLVRIRATAVTASDIFIRGSQIPWRFRIPMRLMIGVTRPRRSIIGLVYAGDVAAVGENVTRLAVGDRVHGITGFDLGAYAEYACVNVTDSKHGCVARMPANATYEEATVAAYGGLLALQYLDRGYIAPGHDVLIYGASGTCGTTAVQIAKHWGARVTAVCGTAHVDLVKSLGADVVLDYRKQDALDPSARFDFVLDAVGRAKTSKLKEAALRALKPTGTRTSIDDGALEASSARLDALRGMIEAGHVKPVIDRTYAFEDLPEAHRYVEQGHKVGGVAVTVSERY